MEVSPTQVEIKDSIVISFKNNGELQNFKAKVKDCYVRPVFEFQENIFNFEKFERKSIDVLLDQLNWVEKFLSKDIIA